MCSFIDLLSTNTRFWLMLLEYIYYFFIYVILVLVLMLFSTSTVRGNMADLCVALKRADASRIYISARSDGVKYEIKYSLK
jgi:hypothetical protein